MQSSYYSSNLPLVSYIIPSLNQHQFIGRAIESILNQDYPNVQIVVQDGGSTDGTLDVLKKWENEIFVEVKKDSGPAEAINRGLNRATGDWLAVLPADDFLYPNAVSALVNASIKNPEYDFIYGKANHVDKEGEIIKPYPVCPWDRNRLLEICFICLPGCMIRSDLFRSGRPFREDIHPIDYEYWLRHAKNSKFLFVDKVVAAQSLYSDTQTFNNRYENHHQFYRLTKAYNNGKPVPKWSRALIAIRAELPNNKEVSHTIESLIRAYRREAIRLSIFEFSKVPLDQLPFMIKAARKRRPFFIKI